MITEITRIKFELLSCNFKIKQAKYSRTLRRQQYLQQYFLFCSPWVTTFHFLQFFCVFEFANVVVKGSKKSCLWLPLKLLKPLVSYALKKLVRILLPIKPLPPISKGCPLAEKSKILRKILIQGFHKL